MSMRALLLAVAVILLATDAAPAAATRVPRFEWIPVTNVSNPYIQELGRWAVAEHVRRAHDGLQFGRVARAQEQMVGGTNYKLFLNAADASGKTAAYAAVVYEHWPAKIRELTSFAPAGKLAGDGSGRPVRGVTTRDRVVKL